MKKKISYMNYKDINKDKGVFGWFNITLLFFVTSF